MAILTDETISADALAAELLAESLHSENGFTITKTLGTVKTRRADDGTMWVLSDAEAANVSRAAVRLVQERFPELDVRFRGITVSEADVRTDDGEYTDIETRTEAVITVPDSFVQLHNGTDFCQLLQAEWLPQLSDLTERITARLRRHEIRTARMFGKNPNAAAASFRITEDTAESDIWTIPLARCGFYPLQWDSEVCGMARLLAERIREALTEDCGDMLETAVRRNHKQKHCTVFLYYSIKQD